MREHDAQEIIRFRKRLVKPDNAAIVKAVNDYKSILQARMDAELAEYEATLRAPSGDLTRAEQAEYAGRMASLVTSLTLEYGEKADVESYISEVEKNGEQVPTG
jgi:hypothetical protein